MDNLDDACFDFLLPSLLFAVSGILFPTVVTNHRCEPLPLTVIVDNVSDTVSDCSGCRLGGRFDGGKVGGGVESQLVPLGSGGISSP